MTTTFLNGVDASGARELWKTDGTAAGTIELTRGQGGTGGLNPQSIAVLGSEVLFNAPDPTLGSALWAYSLVTGVTTELPVSGAPTVAQVPGGFDPQSLTVYNGAAYFIAPGAPEDLWRTDGTSAGTVPFGAITGVDPTKAVSDLQVLEGKLSFIATASPGLPYAGRPSVYESDGTSMNTDILRQGAYGPYGGTSPYTVAAIGSDLIYGAELFLPGIGPSAYTFSGTDGYILYYPARYEPAVSGSQAFFLAGPSFTSSVELFRSDGTAGGTYELTGVVNTNAQTFLPGPPAAAGARAVFAGTDAAGNRVLWSSDGSVAGTVEIGLGILGNPSNLTTISPTQVMFAAGGLDGNGLWVTDGTAAGTYEISAGTLAASSGLAPSGFAAAPFGSDYALIPPHVATADFSLDGRSDLVLQADNGVVSISDAAGLSLGPSVQATSPGATWHVMATGDFNGDGRPDLVLQNDSGAVMVDLMDGPRVTSSTALGNPGASWHVRGTGDFDGDGKSDILLQNDDGTMVTWTMNGSVITGGAVVGTLPQGWTVASVADFTGDGAPDILVQDAPGALVEYTVVHSVITGGGYVGAPGPGWAVTGSGDYNGDGRADILLHSDGGEDDIWELNGSSLAGATALGNPGSGWSGAVGGVDLDGDGSVDLVVQNRNGVVVGYTLNNSAAITAGATLLQPGAATHVVADVPMFIENGSGANTLTATPGQDQFVETTAAAGQHVIAGFDPALDSIALAAAQFPSFDAVQAAETAVPGGTSIALGSGATLLIQGVMPGQLSVADFVLR